MVENLLSVFNPLKSHVTCAIWFFFLFSFHFLEGDKIILTERTYLKVSIPLKFEPCFVGEFWLNLLLLRCTARPLSVLLFIQNFIKLSCMVEDLRQFPYFHIFGLGRVNGVCKLLSDYPICLPMSIHLHIFTFFGLSVSAVNGKWYLTMSLARACQYLCVYNFHRNILYLWRPTANFHIWGFGVTLVK